MAAAFVSVQQLSKRFGDFLAVDQVSLQVENGTMLALLGPNGAGKTTLMRMLMGQLMPSDGMARIGGFDCFAERPRIMSLVGYVPDDPGFHDFLTGRELIRFVGTLHGLSAETVRVRAEHLCQRLALDEALDEFAINYSKGMKKKLAMIMALMHEPGLLILDEPTNGLDPMSTQVAHGLLHELVAGGTAVLYSTHLLDQVERLGGSVAIMAKGRLISHGTLEQLHAHSGGGGSLQDVFLALTAAASAGAVAAATPGAGGQAPAPGAEAGPGP